TAAGYDQLVIAERAELSDVEQDRLERLFVQCQGERAQRAVEAFGGWWLGCRRRLRAGWVARLRGRRTYSLGGALLALGHASLVPPYVRTCPLPRTTNLVVVRPSAPIGP